MDDKGAGVTDLMRHIRRAHSAVLPGAYLPFKLSTQSQVGWVEPGFGDMLAQHGCVCRDGAVLWDGGLPLQTLAVALAEAGAFSLRNEAFDVRAVAAGTDWGPVLGVVDRGALPKLGISGQGTHVNGLVRREDGVHVWVARRAANRAIDPGKLDHLVAGGISAGMDARTTLLKEAGEEAGVPPALARQARLVSRITYAMARPEGLRRDVLHCFDLALPPSFEPASQDGEVEAFNLWPLRRVLEAVRETDDFKVNVNLVLIDLFLREGLIDTDGAEGSALRRALG